MKGEGRSSRSIPWSASPPQEPWVRDKTREPQQPHPICHSRLLGLCIPWGQEAASPHSALHSFFSPLQEHEAALSLSTAPSPGVKLPSPSLRTAELGCPGGVRGQPLHPTPSPCLPPSQLSQPCAILYSHHLSQVPGK